MAILKSRRAGGEIENISRPARRQDGLVAAERKPFCSKEIMMKRKMNDKLALNRETLRTLSGLDLFVAQGGGTTSTTGESNTVYTCDTCFGPSCRNDPTTTGTSVCC
jgi:hypothetical protein